MTLDAFEAAVIDALLAGEHPTLMRLRRQRESISVVQRQQTGVGFYSDLVVDPALRCDGAPDFELGDVDVEMEGLEHDAGGVLFVRGGLLVMLEGFTYDEPWPTKLAHCTLRYRQLPRDLTKLG